jgi:hypothetical protein
MVITRLIGGLGNQCFQYALGRHLAEIHHSELKIDISEFETYKLHAYSLSSYNIIENFATSEDIARLKHVREKHLHFDPEVLHLPDGIYLHGYWPSEKYFTSIADIMHRELTVKLHLSGRDNEIADQITSCDSVSVHIRRGDYLPNTYSEQLLETSSLEYYLCSVEHIIANVNKPHIFVFTDDKAWARENFNLPYPITFVDHNGPDKNHEDLRLMSLCKHNIIANSTFSWWGAWLNNNPDKIVCAPNKWFTDKAKSSSKDLIPDSWVKI